jgi:hypothetical protein
VHKVGDQLSPQGLPAHWSAVHTVSVAAVVVRHMVLHTLLAAEVGLAAGHMVPGCTDHWGPAAVSGHQQHTGCMSVVAVVVALHNQAAAMH